METRRHYWIAGIVFLIVLISLVCVVWAVSVKRQLDDIRPIALTQTAMFQATTEAETWLTQEHAEQVSQIIEEFEIQSGSLDFISGKDIGAEITTGYFRQIYGRGAFPEPGSIWIVVTSASVRQVRVIEYTPERIKAVATVDRVYNNMTIEGEIIEASLSDYRCGVYVFLREDSHWKLAGFFPTLPPRSGDIYNQWDYLDQEMKDTIGDLPDGDLCP